MYQVQQIDSDIDRASRRVAEIDKLIQNNKTIASAEKALEEQQQIFLQRTNEFNQINDEMEKKRIKKSQSQSSLYSGKVQNPKELEDLQHEISSLEKVIASLEDTQMQALIALDTAENNLDTAKLRLKKAKSAFATEVAMLRAEKDALLKSIEGLQAKRDPIMQLVAKEYQAQYKSLRKQKKGVAVTKLNDSSCGACGGNLTASQAQSARSSKTIFICPNCGRIIYGGH